MGYKEVLSSEPLMEFNMVEEVTIALPIQTIYNRHVEIYIRFKGAAVHHLIKVWLNEDADTSIDQTRRLINTFNKKCKKVEIVFHE